MSLESAEALIQAAAAQVGLAAVAEDQVEEAESYNSALEIDNEEQTGQTYYLPCLSTSTKKQKKDTDDQTMLDSLKKASADVIVTGTQNEYRRLWDSFVKFCCVHIDGIETAADIEALVPKLPAQFPNWIAYWIMDRCDSQSPFTGQEKHPSEARASYNAAQKMCAAISHKFGREYGRGTQPWAENPFKPGEYTGSPSLAIPVCQYMISLRRRKVRAGEVVTSARAMDEPTMKKLYTFNKTFDPNEEHTLQPRKRKQEDQHCWAGYGLRLMLMLLYCVSMLCLLRYDEALKITWADVSFEYDLATNTLIVRLDLPFRKTHQNGGILPFYLYPDNKRLWLCPVTLFAEWWVVSGGKQGGYVFRRKRGNRFSSDGFEKMVSTLNYQTSKI
ncbi:hypothetical protein HWV62_20590 [Athelia sp. TMB]|nr:hypothetical protein HWV62_20590 [Athelia sp. TMB]